MKFVYLAHPLKGDGKTDRIDNYDRITAIARQIATTEDVCPISPIHAFSFLDVADTEEDERARVLCRYLVSMVDEVRVFGDWETSAGCSMEIEIARELGTPIAFEDGHVEGGY